jgi:hypothetical protein
MGEQFLQGDKLTECEEKFTDENYTTQVIKNPRADYPVSTIPMFKNGTCSGLMF